MFFFSDSICEFPNPETRHLIKSDYSNTFDQSTRHLHSNPVVAYISVSFGLILEISQLFFLILCLIVLLFKLFQIGLYKGRDNSLELCSRNM